MSNSEAHATERKTKPAKFPDEILEYIADILAVSRSGSDITRFFRSAGYTEFVHDGSTKKWFVLSCLQKLNERNDGPYHVVKVIEKLSDPKQYIGKPEAHKTIVAALNNALIFHSLKLNQENKVVISSDLPPTKPPDIAPTKSEIEIFHRIVLHPKIKEVSQDLFRDGHYAQAIFEAFKVVNNAVKVKSGLVEKDGQPLMAIAFSGSPPPLAFNTLQTQSEKDEQDGFKFLFMGAMAGIRNPKAHENVKQNDPYRTLHYLAFASLLMTRLDESVKTSR